MTTRRAPPVGEQTQQPPTAQTPNPLLTPTRLTACANAWAEHNSLRLIEVLPQKLAEATADAILNTPLQSYHQHDEHIRCFMWRAVLPYDPKAPGELHAPFGEIASWLQHDLPALATALTGRRVHPPTHSAVPLCVFRKGCYLDTHNDYSSGAAIAWVLGLTRESWDLDLGGSLEFVSNREGSDVLERRRPGFNTLDLYTVHPVARWHRVPLLRTDVLRVTVSGWLPIDASC